MNKFKKQVVSLKQTYKSLLFISETMDFDWRAGSDQQAEQSTHQAEGLNPWQTCFSTEILLTEQNNMIHGTGRSAQKKHTTFFECRQADFPSADHESLFQAGSDQQALSQSVSHPPVAARHSETKESLQKTFVTFQTYHSYHISLCFKHISRDEVGRF